MGEAATQTPNLFLRSQLLDRRHRLESTRTALPETEVVRLLAEVDKALEQMNEGRYGICQVCHEPIEEERLLCNPLAGTCLDHMTRQERQTLERDLDLAMRVQTGLLPERRVRLGEWEGAYHYEPLGAVSGDFCDLSPAQDGLFLLVGDIAGKGVSASLLMSNLHAIFRSLVSVGMPLAELLERANRLFCEATRPPYYATLVGGFAYEDGKVELINAGHCPPLLLQDGAATEIQATGLPVGLFCEAKYAPRRLKLQRGDALVLYSDGLSESRNVNQEEYGVTRIAGALQSCRDKSATGLINSCLDDLLSFRLGAAKVDDLTLAVIRRVD